uniref:Uncharacterized protein n=1 Tax=Catagonus wagneri TaxID=51154 RepID=A0A8C3YUL6_9CETA
MLTTGDVKLAASTHVSKISLATDHSSVGSMPLTEAPAFILPPRNLCIKEGATAKFEGRVRKRTLIFPSLSTWKECLVN